MFDRKYGLVAQLIRVICAECGEEVSFSNRWESDIVTLEKGFGQTLFIFFNCPVCGCRYDIPFKEVTYE